MEKIPRSAVMILLPAITIIGGAFAYFRFLRPQPTDNVGRVPEDQNEGVEIEERASALLNRMGVTADRTYQLRSVNESLSQGGFGVASWAKRNDKTTVTVTASLPAPQRGFYQAWLITAPDIAPSLELKLGTLRKEKAGYVLDFSSTSSLTSYSRAVVSLEQQDDAMIEARVLEGEIRFE